MRLEDTFAANTTHTSLFRLLSDYQLVYSAMIMIVRTWMERGHIRMEKWETRKGYGEFPHRITLPSIDGMCRDNMN